MKIYIMVIFFLIFTFGFDGSLCAQECNSDLLPCNDFNFVLKEGDHLCFLTNASPDQMLQLLPKDQSSPGFIIGPLFPAIDNGLQFPGKVHCWDEANQFIVHYGDYFYSCGEDYIYTVETASCQAPPQLQISEISFRKKHKKYYLRIISEKLSDNPSCITLRLNGTSLPITRYEHGETTTLLEGLIGNEKQFIALAGNLPPIELEDSCLGKSFYPTVISKEPYAHVDMYNVHMRFNGNYIIEAGLGLCSPSGGEIVFFSYAKGDIMDRASLEWVLINIPTYKKYDGDMAGMGRIPPSLRKVWKEGKRFVVIRVYDYLGSNFFGVAF